MPRPIAARIDLDALRHNFAVARRHSHGARVWGVVKANAYGHGFERATSALWGLADGFALLDIADALSLRERGYLKPLMLLEGCFDDADLLEASHAGVTTVVHCDEQLDRLVSASLPAPLDVYLKLNTGMNRLGLPVNGFRTAFDRLRGCRNVAGITLMTHFAEADSGRGIEEQHALFASTTDLCDLPRSLANSAALLRHGASGGDWVRPGIMLYGASPFADVTAAELDLRPVMTLQSEIIGVQALEAGARVGYGGTFEAAGHMRIGIVACGYADGYPRHAPTGTPVLVEGIRTRLLGRVSMDMLAVDLTPIPGGGVGSDVTLWGVGLPADEVASAAGTISYELFCALAPRVQVTTVGA